MAKCKNCRHLMDAVNVFDGKEHEFKWCPVKDDNPDIEIERECESYEVMTNADRIRSMTDEELAVVIMCPHGIDGSLCLPDHDCVKCTLEWLKKPVEV